MVPMHLSIYVHFKGTGLTPSERYENQGWGLQQVIEEMESAPTTLYSFVQAAKHMLSRRVANAPIERRMNSAGTPAGISALNPTYHHPNPVIFRSLLARLRLFFLHSLYLELFMSCHY